MRFKDTQKTGDGERVFVFEIGNSEMHWFRETLRQYPLLDPAYHKLSHTEKISSAGQHWLETSIAEKRQENSAFLEELLGTAKFVPQSPEALELRLNPEQANRLLQILNDIRIGSWNQLGKPDPESAEKIAVTDDNARYVTAMELSGYFEMSILEAFRSV